MIAPSIQKDIINSCAKETTKAIIAEISDECFVILADEFADISDKEELSVCLCYVSKSGGMVERFLGIVHVPHTTSLTIKNAIESLLMEHSLTLSKVRGQAYDGASNMRGSIGGLNTLILNESSSAHYVHCFAHQFQLALVATSKKSQECRWLFDDVLPLDNRFSEKTKELLICMASFSPSDGFSSFDTKQLLKFATFYPIEFPKEDLLFFEQSLISFIGDVRNDERFLNVKTLNELSLKLVETRMYETHSDVYKLLKLVLLLPVTTASVKRSFSTMNHIKNKVRNSMGEQLLNDCMITFLEKDLFLNVTNDAIVHRFQNMKTRRELL